MKKALVWTYSQSGRKTLVEQGFTVVANQRKGADTALIAWAIERKLAVLIDRKSDWGNPFELPGDGTRDEVCDHYAEHYFPFKPSLKKRLPELKGKVLVCWCHPERCHGDYLAFLANSTTEEFTP
jgi:hypothetical protein